MRSRPEIKPAIRQAVTGAVVVTVVGFWALGGPAEHMARDRADIIVVDALTPATVAGFEAQADAAAKLAEFKKISTKGGWATTPGSAAPNSDVATARAATLGKAT